MSKFMYILYGLFTLTDSDFDSKPNGCIVLYNVHIAQTQTGVPTPYFCVVQESESESVPESDSSNINESLDENNFL